MVGLEALTGRTVIGRRGQDVSSHSIHGALSSPCLDTG
ncbi:hypothetical protein H4W80_006883 [Nonomuraea angiospora]|uniref:Uncharacterized protein n=1 Tax=Nonomuraea angiospora TaxID=46172 RepID=A0ABR9M7M6_9ACTN|nr:hypothetical protein [Nonomuraea angiospora]